MRVHQLSVDNLYTGVSYSYPGNVAPYGATHIPPLAYNDGFAQRFDPAGQTWAYVPLEELVPPPPPPLPLEDVRAAKLAELTSAFEAAEAGGHCVSSLGFEVDATERANRDVGGLIVSMSQAGAPASTYFCDYTNQMRGVTLADLRILQLEIIAYGQQLYARKWQLREAINAATSVAELEAVEIVFDTLSAPQNPGTDSAGDAA